MEHLIDKVRNLTSVDFLLGYQYLLTRMTENVLICHVPGSGHYFRRMFYFTNLGYSAIGSILTKNGLRVEDVEGITRFC